MVNSSERETIMRRCGIAALVMWLVAVPLAATAIGDFAPGLMLALILVVFSVPVGLTAAIAWLIGLFTRDRNLTDLNLDEPAERGPTRL